MTTVNQLHIIQCKRWKINLRTFCSSPGIRSLLWLHLTWSRRSTVDLPASKLFRSTFLGKHKASWLQFCIGRDVSVEGLIQIYMTMYLLAGTVPGDNRGKNCAHLICRGRTFAGFSNTVCISSGRAGLHLQEFVSIAGMLSFFFF